MLARLIEEAYIKIHENREISPKEFKLYNDVSLSNGVRAGMAPFIMTGLGAGLGALVGSAIPDNDFIENPVSTGTAIGAGLGAVGGLYTGSNLYFENKKAVNDFINNKKGMYKGE